MMLFLSASSRLTRPDAAEAAHFALTHAVYPLRSEWMSICGYPFLSYEVSRPREIVSCLWCLAQLQRRTWTVVSRC